MLPDRIRIQVDDEVSSLSQVVLGIATNTRNIPIAHNPISATNLKNGTYPSNEALCRNLVSFESILKKNGVIVYKPEDLMGVNQIFIRDIGFVIGHYFVVAQIPNKTRSIEFEGIKDIVSRFDTNYVLRPPDSTLIEGGDVILRKNYVFVGIGTRTNQAGVEYLQETFRDREIIPLPLVTSEDPRINVLHLDCAFQPIGERHAIIFEDGFRKRPDILYDLFGENNLIQITKNEMYQLASNLLSINPTKIISERGLKRLNNKLRQLGFEVIEVHLRDIARLGGLFRCITLPLQRGNHSN